MRVYNLGSLNIDYVYEVDHFVSAGETLASDRMQVFPGGKGLNQSVALARAGVQVVHGALVGKDGMFLVETLRNVGVDVSRIRVVDAPSGHAIIQVDRRGQNCILLFPGTNYAVDLAYAETFLSDASENDILLLQNETSGLDELFSVARRKKMQIAFNPSPFHKNIKTLPLSWVDWWFCNEIEGRALFGSEDPHEIAAAFRARFPEGHLILTLGDAGSVFIDAQQYVKQSAYPAEAVDTTAAGDTFTGYFLAAVMSGQSAVTALDLASKAASVTVSRMGASVSIPTMAEVECVFGDHTV